MSSAIIHIREHKIVNNGTIRKLFNDLADGKYLIEISRHNKRSTPQNRYYWGLIIPVVQKGIKDLGTELTTEETHQFLKARFNFQEIVNHETGEAIPVPRSTTGLTKIQFAEYIDNIQRFAVEFLNIIIPDPGEQQKLEYVD